MRHRHRSRRRKCASACGVKVKAALLPANRTAVLAMVLWGTAGYLVASRLKPVVSSVAGLFGLSDNYPEGLGNASYLSGLGKLATTYSWQSGQPPKLTGRYYYGYEHPKMYSAGFNASVKASQSPYFGSTDWVNYFSARKAGASALNWTRFLGKG